MRRVPASCRLVVPIVIPKQRIRAGRKIFPRFNYLIFFGKNEILLAKGGKNFPLKQDLQA